VLRFSKLAKIFAAGSGEGFARIEEEERKENKEARDTYLSPVCGERIED
jgi:hypothetical protein